MFIRQTAASCGLKFSSTANKEELWTCRNVVASPSINIFSESISPAAKEWQATLTENANDNRASEQENKQQARFYQQASASMSVLTSNLTRGQKFFQSGCRKKDDTSKCGQQNRHQPYETDNQTPVSEKSRQHVIKAERLFRRQTSSRTLDLHVPYETDGNVKRKAKKRCWSPNSINGVSGRVTSKHEANSTVYRPHAERDKCNVHFQRLNTFRRALQNNLDISNRNCTNRNSYYDKQQNVSHFHKHSCKFHPFCTNSNAKECPKVVTTEAQQNQNTSKLQCSKGNILIHHKLERNCSDAKSEFKLCINSTNEQSIRPFQQGCSPDHDVLHEKRLKLDNSFSSARPVCSSIYDASSSDLELPLSVVLDLRKRIHCSSVDNIKQLDYTYVNNHVFDKANQCTQLCARNNTRRNSNVASPLLDTHLRETDKVAKHDSVCLANYSYISRFPSNNCTNLGNFNFVTYENNRLSCNRNAEIFPNPPDQFAKITSPQLAEDSESLRFNSRLKLKRIIMPSCPSEEDRCFPSIDGQFNKATASPSASSSSTSPSMSYVIKRTSYNISDTLNNSDKSLDKGNIENIAVLENSNKSFENDLSLFKYNLRQKHHDDGPNTRSIANSPLQDDIQNPRKTNTENTSIWRRRAPKSKHKIGDIVHKATDLKAMGLKKPFQANLCTREIAQCTDTINSRPFDQDSVKTDVQSNADSKDISAEAHSCSQCTSSSSCDTLLSDSNLLEFVETPRNSYDSLVCKLTQGLEKQRKSRNFNMRERIRINVSGMYFETWRGVLDSHPDTLLGNPKKRAPFFDSNKEEYFFDRHRPTFEAIFNYYQYGGKLKRPGHVPDEIFLSELKFYEIETEVIEAYKKDEGYVREDIVLPTNRTKRMIWMLFEFPETSNLAFIIAVFSVICTLTSIVLFCVETLPKFANTHCEDGELPNFLDAFFLLETGCTVWFTVEVVVRFAVCPSRRLFVLDMKNAVDVAAIVPYYVTLINVLIKFSCSGAKNSASLAFLRVIRLIRVFKLTKHSSGLQVLLLTFRASLEGLGVFLVALIVSIILFSSTLYYVEVDHKDSQIESIPDAFWWAITTMCTVGYGDKVPKSPWGKFVGSVCALAGVLALAIPVPIITENFNKFYAHKTGRVRI